MVARIGAMAGPLLGGAMVAAAVSPNLFFAAAAGPAVLCVLVSLAVPLALAVRRRSEATA
jgi:MFS family permease